ncbi:hypothetical protein, partial [Pseudomaricurvus sp.]|uniref:hypothetical protein n=1 Tax=Pseudomaricurvus sp. TaxID=2004510 RepID=UPI003F6C7E7B
MTVNLDISGYEIGPVLHRHNGHVVYRARRLADNAVVAIETIDSEYPDRQQVARIRREGTITQRLVDINGVRKIDCIVPHGSGNLALIGEPFEGTLRAHLNQAYDLQNDGSGHQSKNSCLPLTQGLDIALQLARILGQIHTRDLVHKALTPDHILFNPASGAITVAGFGI